MSILLAAGVMVFWLMKQPDKVVVWTVIPMVFLLPVFGIASSAFTFGRKALRGYHVITVRNGRLTSVGYPRFIRRNRRTVAVDRIDQFEIDGLDALPLPRYFKQLATLSLSSENKGTLLAWGYPKPWLQNLAEHLTEECQASSSAHLRSRAIPITSSGASPDDRVAPAVTGVGSAPGQAAPPVQPRTSTADYRETSGGCVVELPAMGLRRAATGTIVLEAIFVGVAALLTFLLIGAEFESEPGTSPIWGQLAIYAINAVFWAIGLGFGFFTLNAARRRGKIELSPYQLRITEHNLVSQNTHEWSLDEIKRVGVHASGTEINDVPVHNLHVIPLQGKTIKLFPERHDTELEWLAALIRFHLRQASSPPAQPSVASPPA